MSPLYSAPQNLLKLSGIRRRQRRIGKQGRKYLNEELFNGEYFYHKIDLKDKSIPESFGDVQTYWFAERKEIKYQVGEGCGIDQVLAGYHTCLIGEQSVFDQDKLRSALQAIYRHNFVRARDIYNPCRIFAANDECGVMIVTYPEGVKKPTVSCPYAQEMMNGFEYQFAVHLLFEGMEEESMSIVHALQKRYDGENRNPYSEIECGNDYVRSLASFSFLNAYSGLKVYADGRVFAQERRGFSMLLFKRKRVGCL